MPVELEDISSHSYWERTTILRSCDKEWSKMPMHERVSTDEFNQSIVRAEMLDEIHTMLRSLLSIKND